MGTGSTTIQQNCSNSDARTAVLSERSPRRPRRAGHHDPRSPEVKSERALWVPSAMNMTQRFEPDKPPFSDFSNLVKWRNNAIHHVAEYARARDQRSHTFNQFNLENADLAIKNRRQNGNPPEQRPQDSSTSLACHRHGFSGLLE